MKLLTNSRSSALSIFRKVSQDSWVLVRDANSDGGTDVIAVHEGLPHGVAPADNETGWAEALARLAALVEKS